jgi:predicted ester cyclase
MQCIRFGARRKGTRRECHEVPELDRNGSGNAFSSSVIHSFLSQASDNGGFRRRAYLLFQDICGSSFDIIPSSFVREGVTLMGQKAFKGGAWGDIYEATYNGQKVALKRLRVFQNTDLLEFYKVSRFVCWD